MTWLEYFRMVLEWIALEISALPHNDFLRRARARAADFWRRTQILALGIIIVPIIIFIAGIILHNRSIVAIAGLLSTILWGAILFSFAAIAELIAAVYREVRGLGGEALGRIYLKAVATILLGEMLVVGYVIIVPVWNNPGAIPIVAMMAIILATMMVVWEMRLKVFRQIAFWIAVVAFVFSTASFFIPGVFSVLEKRALEIEQHLSGWMSGDNPGNYYKDQRKILLDNWYQSEQKAIIAMLAQGLIKLEGPGGADDRMDRLNAQFNEDSQGISDPNPAPLGDKLKKNIPNLPLALKLILVAAAAFLILGLIWNKFLKNGWLKTAALLAIGGTAICFIIAILQSNGVAI